ncbi:MAG: hypothetical protein RLZZ292_2758 [Bacteroidota bacterium]
MPYSQYNTLQSVRQKLGITTHFRSLFSEAPPVAPSDWLLQTLTRYTKARTAYFNEKSRSEAIVFPILSELQNSCNFTFALYSGATIEGDQDLGLNGECDFVLSQAKQSIELERPVFCIVEAKDNDIELGIPQCMAQLYGARLFNEKVGEYSPTIMYGAVTTGTEWNFLQMTKNEIIIDNDFYYIKNLPELLGVLNHIVKQFSV